MKRLTLVSMAAALVLSCGDDAAHDPYSAGCPDGLCAGGPTFVIAQVTPLQTEAPGVSRGFNLDGLDVPPGPGCGSGNFVDPDGNRGIDNQFARILPVVIDAVGEALPYLIHNAITDGGLQVLVELANLDDWRNDDSVDVVFHRGVTVPLVGNDGLLISSQTLQLADEPILGVCRGAKLVDGVLEGGPCDIHLAIGVFQNQYRFNLRGSLFRMKLAPDGSGMEILLGGAIPVEDVIDVADTIGDVDGLDQLVKTMVPPFADQLDEEGDCTRISGAFDFLARPGFAVGTRTNLFERPSSKRGDPSRPDQ